MPTPLTPTPDLQHPVLVIEPHAAVTADSLARVMRIPPTRTFRLDRAEYYSSTGLAQDAANFFSIQVLKNATVAASWSTQTGAQGTIAADTWVTLVNSATDANLVFAAGDVISLNLDETGTATLPAGKICLYGRWI
jgi:hypothetical protein